MKKKIQQVLENKTSADQDLFALLGLAGLTTEEQQTLLASLSDIVFQGVFAEAIPRIPEDKLAEFTKLTGGKGNEVEVFEFLETNVPEFNEIIESEIQNLQDSLRRTLPPLSEEEKALLQ
jgi:hypothetical protein